VSASPLVAREQFLESMNRARLLVAAGGADRISVLIRCANRSVHVDDVFHFGASIGA
jgi:hypothetical protein